ncbi:hypothetical protein U3516DRAFT_737793 [Neocallimastix sp. 'constans']
MTFQKFKHSWSSEIGNFIKEIFMSIIFDFPDVSNARKGNYIMEKEKVYQYKSPKAINENDREKDHFLIIIEGKSCILYLQSLTKFHDTVNKTDATFKWGLRHTKDMEKMDHIFNESIIE